MIRRILCLWLCLQVWPCLAQQPTDSDAELNRAPKLTVENIRQATEILRDPTVGLDSLRQVLRNQAGKASSSAAAVPNSLQDDVAHSSSFTDPTQMTGSFSEALSRLKAKPGAASASSSDLPSVRLVAKAIGRGEQKAAMLDVGGTVLLLRPGDKLSFQKEKDWYEVVVNVIEDDHVEVTLLPSGRRMILR